LQRPRFAKVADRWHLICALLGGAVELGQRYDRHIEFFGEQLEGSGELTHLLLAALDLLAARQELQVVNDDHLQTVLLLESATLRADFDEGEIRAVVDEER